MTDDLETWYAALGIAPYQVCSNVDPWLTLTCFTSRSESVTSAFMWKKKAKKSDFKHTWAFGSLVSLKYVSPSVVCHLSTFSNILSSKTTVPIEVKISYEASLGWTGGKNLGHFAKNLYMYLYSHIPHKHINSSWDILSWPSNSF